MEELKITAALIAGIILRIGLPIGITFLLARFLRKLDSRWREEAEREAIETKLLQQRQTLLNSVAGSTMPRDQELFSPRTRELPGFNTS